MFLRSFGLNPKMISMDDYFVERDETPLNEKGEKDNAEIYYRYKSKLCTELK